MLYTQYKHNSYISIKTHVKTHDSESRGQEEAGRTRRMSVLFTFTGSSRLTIVSREAKKKQAVRDE